MSIFFLKNDLFRKKDINVLKGEYDMFKLLNNIMIEGQALRMRIGLVASNNKEYEKQLKHYYS